MHFGVKSKDKIPGNVGIGPEPLPNPHPNCSFSKRLPHLEISWKFCLQKDRQTEANKPVGAVISIPLYAPRQYFSKF